MKKVIVICRTDQIQVGDEFPLYGKVGRINRIGNFIHFYDNWGQRIAKSPWWKEGWHMTREVEDQDINE